MYCLNVITDDLVPLLGRLLESIARYLFFFIGKFIYGAIRYIYNIFVALCNGRILDNDSIMALFSRIGVILGVIMLFVVSFSVIQLLVDPDAIADKEKGIQNIVKKVIFVIIMLGVSGYVFNILTDVQAIVIKRDIIPRLLLPKAVSTENVGGNLSAELFMIFYQVGVEPEDDACGETYRDSTKAAIANGDFTPVSTCLIDGAGEGDGWVFSLEYNWLFSTIFGVAALWLIFSYCISVGIRIIQLTFLQIISPAAIIGYLSPKKDNIFSKWIKIYFSTYIDVFIRIAIINFAMYLIALIMDGWQNQTTGFWASVGSPGLGTKGFIAAIMIMAILQFAKKAPELLKKLLPAGESGLGFGIGGEGALAGIGALAGFGVGAVGRLPGMIGNVNDAKGLRGKAGALAAGLGGISLGGLTGIARGGHAGYGSKGLGSAITGGGSAQGKANLARAQRIANGIGLGEYIGTNVRGAFGVEARSARDERNISTLTNYAKMQDTMEGYANKNKKVKELKRAYEAIQQAGRQVKEYDSMGNAVYETDKEFTDRIESARSAWANARDSFIDASLSGRNNFKVNGETVDIENDDGLYASIRSTGQEMNRMATENPSLFEKFGPVDSFDKLESNTSKANTEIANRKATQRRKIGS